MMRKLVLPLLVVLAMFVFAGGALAGPKASRVFVARLSGANEVPVRETPARGTALFQANKNDTALRYKLVVAKISNVSAAHIHCAPAGENGPVGVTLFQGTAGSGPAQGVIAQGVLTMPDAGNACGWMTMEDVVAAMRSGGAYVNVHTNDGVAPTNTGPGDFPGGEIRGQIMLRGAR